MALLGRAAAALRQRGLRMSVNAWWRRRRVGARRARWLRVAGGGATRQALNGWRAMVDERAMVRRAGASMPARAAGGDECGTGLVAAHVDDRTDGRAAAALRQRGLRASFNGWLEAAAGRRDAIALMVGGRRTEGAFNTWLAVAAERQAAVDMMRRGGGALQRRRRMAATRGSRQRGSGARRSALIARSGSPSVGCARASTDGWAPTSRTAAAAGGWSRRRRGRCGAFNSWRELGVERAGRRAGASLRHRGCARR